MYTTVRLLAGIQPEVKQLAWGLERLNYNKLSTLERAKHILYAIHYSDTKIINMDKIFSNFSAYSGWSSEGYHNIQIDGFNLKIYLEFFATETLKGNARYYTINFNPGQYDQWVIGGIAYRSSFNGGNYLWITNKENWNYLYNWLYIHP